MAVYCNFTPENLYNSVHELIRMAFPGELIRDQTDEHETSISLAMESRTESIILRGEILSAMGGSYDCREFFLVKPPEEQHNEAHKYVRIFTYELLCRHLEKDINPYGILTGMRPVKLVHRLLDQDNNRQNMINILHHEYRLSLEKAKLLVRIASNNRPYLLNSHRAKRTVSIYVGIPYCPSRCNYCSFPGAVLTDYSRDITPFMQALEHELQEVGKQIKQNDLTVQCIYLGGGTPTVLSEKDLSRIFELLNRYYISSGTAEITVEAGRPDTLTLSKLTMLKEAGINRVCINPQTMVDATLNIIGRNHDQKGVMQSVEWAREAGIKKINMDLIVGLPGESIRENTYTAELVTKLKPENITVHTLALKRGSPMFADKAINIGDRVKEVEEGINIFSSYLKDSGYFPYYLYRQKYMKANMENIGYSLADSCCIYNIQVIEERQTIIGMGGGAASKFVNADDWTLTSIYNPKNPEVYCQSAPRLASAKVDKLLGLI